MLQNRPYNELVDVWAAGILLYIMCVNLLVLFLALPHCLGTNLLLMPRRLSGTLPFYADNPDDFLELVLSSSFTFPDSEWAGVSEGRKLLPQPSSHICGLGALFCGLRSRLLSVAPTVVTHKLSVCAVSVGMQRKT